MKPLSRDALRILFNASFDGVAILPPLSGGKRSLDKNRHAEDLCALGFAYFIDAEEKTAAGILRYKKLHLTEAGKGALCMHITATPR